MTKEEKIKFFEFVIDVYTKPDGKKKKNLSEFGFCALLRDFFGDKDIYVNIELIPELMCYKPKELFYNLAGWPTGDKDQFWFPRGDNKKRIEISKAIIKKLKP